MIKSINIGFGVPLSPEDVAQVQAMRLQGVRTELHPDMSDEQILAILAAFVGSRLALLILLHGEAMEGPVLKAQALKAAHYVDVLGLTDVDVELENEPDLSDTSPRVMASRSEMAVRALRDAGFTGKIYGGSVSNLVPRGIDYLTGMDWASLPADLEVAVHRYAPRKTPGASHLASLQHEIVAAMEATVRQTPPALTEVGYHTARQTAAWSRPPPFYHSAFRLTNEQVAEALFNDLHAYASWGVPRCDIFQWNCGVPENDEDYEALYGVRAADGTWLPQGIMLAQIGEL